MSATVNLRVTKVWQYNEKYCVFSGVPLENDYKIKSAKHLVVVKTIPDVLPLEPVPGQHWRVVGDIQEKQAIHGQFKITEQHINPFRCEVTLPHDGENFIRFIAREPDFKGIGEVKAREIWHQLGKSVFDVLQNRDAALLRSLLTETAIENLFEGYRKYANLRHSTWFANHRIPPNIQQRLFKYHGESSVDAIKEDPYRLVSFGMSFDQVDALARQGFSIEPTDERRLVAAVEWAIRKHVESGHTVAERSDLKPTVFKLLGDAKLTSLALEKANNKAVYVRNAETGSYHPTALLMMEQVVAKRFRALAERGEEWTSQYQAAYLEATQSLPCSLTQRQVEAVLMALKRSISTITGGAGTGKTTVLRVVLRAYSRLGLDIKAIALSGRAAMRLKEATDFETSTIAKFLRGEPIESGSTVIVIDEASMLDLATMYRLVTHVSPQARFLLVGDPHQLPPIGAGLILADVVKTSLIPNMTLDIVKRQKGFTGIPEYSNQVRLGNVPPELNMGKVHFHDVALTDVTETCVNLYCGKPFESRVLGATYQAQHGGIDLINQLCQERVNSEGAKLEFQLFGQQHYLNIKLNDPVIFTQNNYDAGVQNGSLGWLVSTEQTGQHYGIVQLEDSGQQILLTHSLLDSVRVAYCISLHKAQGSQFPRVIVPVNRARLLDRSWIYTAITRAEKELHLVGPRSLLEAAILREGATEKRKNYLHVLLGG